jgi:hypothetical protein
MFTTANFPLFYVLLFVMMYDPFVIKLKESLKVSDLRCFRSKAVTLMTSALKMDRKKMLQEVREGNLVVRMLAINGAFQTEATLYFGCDKPHATFKNRGSWITTVISSVAKQLLTLKLISDPFTCIFFFRCLGLGHLGS